MRDENQLHAAVVELYAHTDSEIKYSTVQNWYPGDPETGKGGIYNFVTKRGLVAGERSKISWTQVETGSGITWKHPSVVLTVPYSILTRPHASKPAHRAQQSRWRAVSGQSSHRQQWTLISLRYSDQSHPLYDLIHRQSSSEPSPMFGRQSRRCFVMEIARMPCVC